MHRIRRAAAPFVAQCAVAALLGLASAGPRVASAQATDRSSRWSGQEDTSDPAVGIARPIPHPQVPVHLDAEKPDTWFFYKASAAALRAAAEDGQDVSQSPYLPLCESPCDVSLKGGVAYRLALASGDAKPVEAPDWVVIRGPATVNGHFVDHRSLRMAGWIALPVLAVVGVAMMVGAESWSHTVDQQCAMPGFPVAPGDAVVACNRSHSGPEALWTAGLVTAVLALPTWLFLWTRPDSAEVVVVPGAGSPASSLAGPAARAGEMHERAAGSPGASLQIRF